MTTYRIEFFPLCGARRQVDIEAESPRDAKRILFEDADQKWFPSKFIESFALPSAGPVWTEELAPATPESAAGLRSVRGDMFHTDWDQGLFDENLADLMGDAGDVRLAARFGEAL